ncbi:hypothetical protein JX266_003384 [Neoarthrinium moseri]|nr:hypothetical protein JX266_003384 [Neoarthrinium moseri]
MVDADRKRLITTHKTRELSALAMVRVEVSSLEEMDLEEIHIVCLKGDFQGLDTLLPNREIIEARTALGETPIMLAALMGHVEVFVLLREHRANVEAADLYRRKVIAYAGTSLFTNLRRQVLAGHGFIEKHGANEGRRAITELLTSPAIPRQVEPGSASGGIVFRTNSVGFEAYLRLAYIKTPDIDPRLKTIGFIRKQMDHSPLAFAVSGWKKNDVSQTTGLLQGSKWTKIVLRRVAPTIGFKFRHFGNDQGYRPGKVPESRKGIFFACHVECQLAVWYCYALLAVLKPVPNKRYPSATYFARNLRELAHASLGDSRETKIEINQPPCESCARFLRALTKVTGVSFEVCYRESMSLVPAAIKKRNFLLAHQADLREIAEDSGSDTDGEWDATNDDIMQSVEHMEIQIDMNDPSTLSGAEEMTFRPFTKADSMMDKGEQIKFGDSCNSVSPDEEDGESEPEEDYRDETIDMTYHRSTSIRPQHISHNAYADYGSSFTFQRQGEDKIEDFSRASTPGIVLGTPISTSAEQSDASSGRISPKIPHGTAMLPIVVPSSPTEDRLAAQRLQHPYKRPKHTKVFRQKMWASEERALIALKKEKRQDKSLAVTPRRLLGRMPARGVAVNIRSSESQLGPSASDKQIMAEGTREDNSQVNDQANDAQELFDERLFAPIPRVGISQLLNEEQSVSINHRSVEAPVGEFQSVNSRCIPRTVEPGRTLPKTPVGPPRTNRNRAQGPFYATPETRSIITGKERFQEETRPRRGYSDEQDDFGDWP